MADVGECGEMREGGESDSRIRVFHFSVSGEYPKRKSAALAIGSGRVDVLVKDRDTRSRSPKLEVPFGSRLRSAMDHTLPLRALFPVRGGPCTFLYSLG